MTERVAMHVGEFRELREWQAEPAAHSLGRDEVPIPDISEQFCKNGKALLGTVCAHIAHTAHFKRPLPSGTALLGADTGSTFKGD